jgi:hypothetical protein
VLKHVRELLALLQAASKLNLPSAERAAPVRRLSVRAAACA